MKALVQIDGLPEIYNKIYNKALQITIKHKCSIMTGTQMFLSALTFLDNTNDYLKTQNRKYDLLISSFEHLAGSGDYGILTHENEKQLFFPTEYLISTLQAATVFASNSNNEYILSLLKCLAENPDNYLVTFLDYCEVDLDLIIDDIEDTIAEANKKGGNAESVTSGKEKVSEGRKLPSDIKEYCQNYNEVVAKKDDIISDVSKYTDKMINVLCRKSKNNPIIVGEAGVGKSTIVDALVARINKGDVPEKLKDKEVISVNTSAMISGTTYRGEFEQRIVTLFNYVKEHNAILFVDEVHTFFTLGDNSNAQGIGNSIKTYLNDGSLCIMGTTTNKEWHKFIENDSALKRRLQDINVSEPSVDESIKMLKNSVDNYKKFHSVEISDDILELSVKLSDKYMKADKLPDKAFKIIDQAAAKCSIEGRSEVTPNDIYIVISDITSIDANKISSSEIDKLRELENTIHKNLIGQDEAVKAVVKSIKRGKLNISDPTKPVASFLFVGPTGVGKTELCKIVANELFDNKESFIRFDMSEFSEKGSVSKLFGSAPGYVGYGEGGKLTEAVKKHPNSLILFDEIEKADSAVFDSFLQILDDGRLTDGEGTTVDFTNTIIVMTSNAGYGKDQLGRKVMGFSTNDNAGNKTYKEKEEIAKKALEEKFRPEFINRIDSIIIFESILKEQSVDIARLAIDKLQKRLKDNNYNIWFDESVAKHIAELGYSEKFGARNINRTVVDEVEDFITEEIIQGNIEEKKKRYLYFKDNKMIVRKSKIKDTEKGN